MLKSIMVLLDHTSRSKERLAAAVMIAQAYEAHITGLQVLPSLDHIMSTIPYMSYPADMFREQHDDLKAQANETWKIFERRMTLAGLSFEKHQEEGDMLSYMKFYSHCSDLTIINQNEKGKTPLLDNKASFILESGLPVLAVPIKSIYPTIGSRILVAWNDSAQCARAVHDALPFLKKAVVVSVLCVGEYEKEAVPSADICTHLARHGVKAIAIKGDVVESPEETILSTAENMNADMIVAGAWGHSRVTQMVMGGVTKSLFSNQNIPVFFSH